MQSKNLKSGAGCGIRWLILLIVVMVICESTLAGKVSKKKDAPAKAAKKTGAGGKECRQVCPPCSCGNQYRPVCANNGRVYPNLCKFECAKKCGNPRLAIQREGDGPCEEVPCYPYDPPCKRDLSDKNPEDLC